MKEYRLADTLFRQTVSLKTYEADISKAVHSVKPQACVIVTNNSFIVDPPMTKLESIAVSKILRGGVMNKFTMYRPCLFNGYKIKEISKEEQEINNGKSSESEQ